MVFYSFWSVEHFNQPALAFKLYVAAHEVALCVDFTLWTCHFLGTWRIEMQMKCI